VCERKGNKRGMGKQKRKKIRGVEVVPQRRRKRREKKGQQYKSERRLGYKREKVFEEVRHKQAWREV